MLKAIEVAGFKSFADRARLVFPPGVTVVVGPNGSGKSNVVDAIKWVLGSQSAKSLRGKEMTDVIFNGSASRGPLNTAEATLTLDNSTGLLDIDAAEVHITRRVYRSGEAEYLINRQPCRLRDIRDLLAGTGIATEAYSIIEQGKVDVLLQSSPRDRRIIFEEAAGISRFKTKRAEAARRLERVEQNLLRLSDLVDEVENRLRSVRSQAGKARKYRDYAQRLEQLRTAVGLEDWRKMTQQVEKLSTQIAAARGRCDTHQSAIGLGERQLVELEAQLDSAGEVLRELQTEDATCLAEMAAQRSAERTGRARLVELEEEISRYGRQISAMSTRVENAAQQLREASERLVEASAAREDAAAVFERCRAELASAQAETAACQVSVASTAEQIRRAQELAADLTSKLQGLTALESSAEAARADCRRRLAELGEQHDVKASELREQQLRQQQLAAERDAARDRLDAAQKFVAQRRADVSRIRKKLGQLASDQARLAERIRVLEELEQRHQGYAKGVREVLERVHQAAQGPWSEVLGTVAELFHVDVDTAPLIEIALGERAQHLVVPSGARLLEELLAVPTTVSGRVGFLRLDARLPASAVDRIDLSNESGVLGRADTFVDAAPQVAELSRRLLGRTWLVDCLSTAVRLSTSVGRGLNFVTSGGELLSADGTIVIGPRTVATGLITRASELRASRDQVQELARQMAVQHQQLERGEAELAEIEQQVLARLTEHTGLDKDTAAIENITTRLSGELDSTTRLRRSVAEELADLDARSASAATELQGTKAQLEASRRAVEALESQLAEATARLPDLNAQAEQERQAMTAAEVTLARCEQRVEILHSQHAQIERDQQERAQAQQEAGQQCAACRVQSLAVERSILSATQAIAGLALRRQELTERLRACELRFEHLRHQRQEITHRLRTHRQHLTSAQDEVGRYEVAAGKLEHQRNALWERMRDDYGIDLKQAVQQEVPPLAVERSAVDAEIADLRAKLNGIGAVNLDSLGELDELEQRYENLSGHYRDLVDSKATLERIIQRINVESRKLFVSTLETVRGHFKELFRRLFGGGEADLVLEEGADDVLEGGIDILACPPGKDTRTISLLSGGEKTLTCVALLLAVFRSKPSPFCVLDEVDAALDEANIGRFTNVLGDFLSSTQFIVITHSKKTMSGADTLYGVTMQESGISKLVSVRFEDVTEDGHILPSAAARAASAQPRRAA